MSPVQEIIVVVAVSIAVATGIVCTVCAYLKLWKLKADVQEEIVNIYTPDILKPKEEAEDAEQEKVAEPKADGESAGNDSVG